MLQIAWYSWLTLQDIVVHNISPARLWMSPFWYKVLVKIGEVVKQKKVVQRYSWALTLECFQGPEQSDLLSDPASSSGLYWRPAEVPPHLGYSLIQGAFPGAALTLFSRSQGTLWHHRAMRDTGWGHAKGGWEKNKHTNSTNWIWKIKEKRS